MYIMNTYICMYVPLQERQLTFDFYHNCLSLEYFVEKVKKQVNRTHIHIL